MKIYFFTIIGLSLIGALVYSFSSAKSKKAHVGKAGKNFYDLTIKSLDGKKTLKMSDYKGKYILCVNVASKCGYTPQYSGLQKLQESFKDKLVILGFPCNQFLGQEPGSSEEIATFCQKNYGVTFPITEKIDVKGSGKHPVYQWLTELELNGKQNVSIKWNFNKILIGPDGSFLAYFPSSTEPMSNEITSLIH